MTVNLANAIVDLGVQADLVLARAEGELLSHVAPGVRVVDLGTRRLGDSVVPLLNYLRSREPAGLIARMQHINIVAASAHWIAGSRGRLVLTEATNGTCLFKEGPLRRRLQYRLLMWPILRLVYRRADALVAVSQGVAEDLARRLSVSVSSIQVIPNPVITNDLHQLRTEEPGHEWLRETNQNRGEDSGEHVLLAVGTLREAKDFATLLRAFALLRKSVPARLIICGEGPERQRLESLRSALGLEECVQMPGYDPNPYAAMARASLLILSSRREGSPNVLVEALACGCPVVATDCPSGPAEILDGGRLGLLASVGNPQSLASAMRQSLARTWDAQVLREGVRMFDSRQAAQRYLDLVGVRPPIAGYVQAEKSVAA
jgi:glycosyltransferase involved in cell wall biosynthesis